ncbi:RadC family protein [Thermodesulfobacteriota bacterium]
MTEQTFWQDLKSGRFASMVKESCKGQSVNNSREVYNIMKPMFAENDDVETIYCIFLDAKNNILAVEKMFTGTITASAVYPREIAKRIIALKACAFILTHNHPSGDINPSSEDKAITIKVGIAAESIDVSLHDHIIVGNGFHSMADTGWLKKVSSRFSNLLKSDER